MMMKLINLIYHLNLLKKLIWKIWNYNNKKMKKYKYRTNNNNNTFKNKIC